MRGCELHDVGLDLFSVRVSQYTEEWHPSEWNTMDRDLIDAKKKKWRDGSVVGLWDSNGRYWRTTSTANGLAMFIPVEDCVPCGKSQTISRERFRREFC